MCGAAHPSSRNVAYLGRPLHTGQNPARTDKADGPLGEGLARPIDYGRDVETQVMREPRTDVTPQLGVRYRPHRR